MKKLLLVIGVVVCMWKLAHAQPIVIPASQFPQVSLPSNSMRFLMVYPSGGLSANPLLASNATVSYANLVAALRIAIGTNGGGGGGGGGSASNAIVYVSSNNVPVSTLVTNLNFTNSYGGYTSNRGTVTVDLGASIATANLNSVSNILASLGGGFQFLITSNMNTAQIQGVLNSVTNGGTVSIQPATYDITTPIIITNSMLIEGNLARFKYHLGTTNFMVDTRTNFGKPIVIQDLVFDGGVLAPYLSSTYAPGLGGNNNPYLNQFWTNSSGLRVECSGGAVIRGCYFTGWPGQGLMLLGKFGSLSQSYPRPFVINNTFATNFIGCYLPSHDYEIPGYYNSDSSLWNSLNPEYAQVIDNQFWGNQIAIVPDAGNTTVTGNIINSNYIGMFFQPGANEGHGDYSVNNLNHNIIPIYWQGGPGNAGTFNNNMIYQCQKIVFSSALNIQFKNNILQSTSLIFTNGCQGEISGNTYGQGAGDRWGTDISTNFTGSPNLRIFNNIGSIGTNHDGSTPSIAAFTTNSPTAGYFWSTTDLVHGQWVPGPVSSTNFSGINVTNTASITAGTFGGVQVTNLLNVLTGGALTAYQAGIGFLVASNDFAITYLAPAVSLTNVVLLTTAGDATTNAWPPTALSRNLATNSIQLTNNPTFSVGQMLVITGTNAQGYLQVKATNIPTGGSGSQTPLIQDVNAAGFNGTNYQSLDSAIFNASVTNLSSERWQLANRIGVGIPVPFMSAFANNSVIAYDIMPHGSPSESSGNGFAWMDVVDHDLRAGNDSSYARVAIRSDAAVIASKATGSGTLKPIIFNVGGSDKDTIDVNGKVGIGNILPQAMLHVTGQALNGGIYSQAMVDSTTDAGNFIADDGTAGHSQIIMGTDNSKGLAYIQTATASTSFTAQNLTLQPNGGDTTNRGNFSVGGNFYAKSNTAPSTIISSAGLHTLDIGKGFTNDMNCKATIFLELFFNESAVNGTSFAFQNTNTGASHYGFTNADPANILATYRKIYYFQHIGPGDIGSLFDTSGAGASVTKSQSFWITE